MSEEDDISGLTDLHKTLGDASEVIAAFIGAAHSGEVPVESLIDTADKTLADLVKWRSGLKGFLSVMGEQHH